MNMNIWRQNMCWDLSVFEIEKQQCVLAWPPPIAQSIQFICIFCTLSKSFQQTVYKRSSLSNWGFLTIPRAVLTLKKIWPEIFTHFSIFQRECQNHYYKEWCKICEFFIFRCKARVGNCTLVSVWHPFENYYWICPTSPHHNYISNIFHPKWSKTRIILN